MQNAYFMFMYFEYLKWLRERKCVHDAHVGGRKVLFNFNLLDKCFGAVRRDIHGNKNHDKFAPYNSVSIASVNERAIYFWVSVQCFGNKTIPRKLPPKCACKQL